MRVLVSSTTGYGHVLPMVPLARTLLALGHEVLWATGADALPLVRSAGLAAAPAGMTDAEVAPVRAGLRRAAAGDAVPPERLAEFVFPRMFGAARTPPMLADLLPLARDWAPDLLVHEQGELAAPLVGTALGIPHVTHAFGGATPAATVAEAGERVAGSWADLGLPLPPYAGCYQHLYLDICPPSIQTVPTGHIGTVQPLRPVSWTGPADIAQPVDPDDPTPLVYLTLGTVQDGSSALRPLVAALAGLDVRLLVTVGPQGDPAALGQQPAHVVVERYVSQAAVLPLCTAVVSHAGSGTVLGGLALGLPQVCLPQAADQFRNARGVVRASAGVALHPAEATPAAVLTAVHDVLSRPELAAGAAAVRAEIGAMPAPAEVVRRLEGLVSRGRAPSPGRQ